MDYPVSNVRVLNRCCYGECDAIATHLTHGGIFDTVYLCHFHAVMSVVQGLAHRMTGR